MKQASAKKCEIVLTKDWRDRGMQALKQRNVQNLVIQRLRDSFDGKAGLVITSYDKMHHRHNRS